MKSFISEKYFAKIFISKLQIQRERSNKQSEVIAKNKN